jgi:hypothetical protein
MTMDAYAPVGDPRTATLSTLVSTLAEDAMFTLASGGGLDSLDPLGKRRGEAYAGLLSGRRLVRMLTEFDHWIVEMTRMMAPVYAPSFMPMGDVIREKVTLEAGARGLRSLFSSKPSDKDVQRVKRFGTLAVRVLRGVFAADGPLDQEEGRTLAALIGSLGLSQEDSAPLYNETPVPPEQLDVYGEVEQNIVRALVRGAWHASAWDKIDPREEHVVRTVAQKLAVPPPDVEQMRNEAMARVEARSAVGSAAVDAIRYVMSDRVPGIGVQLASHAGMLLLPRRHRDEVLAQVGHGSPIVLAKRYVGLAPDDKVAVLAIAWAAGLFEDPTMGRRALLRARHDRVAQDLGMDGSGARKALDDWFADVLAPAAFPMGG